MNTVVKGAMFGLATGCVAATAIQVCKNIKQNKMKICSKANKKKAENAVKSIGNAMQDLASIVK